MCHLHEGHDSEFRDGGGRGDLQGRGHAATAADPDLE